MYLFYTPDLNLSDCFLSEEESRHCAKVLRLQKDDLIEIVDGKGSFYHAKIFKIAFANPFKAQMNGLKTR